MPPIKILIVDDDRRIREEKKSLFFETKDFKVIGEARSGIEAVEKVTSNYPDVILMDIDMPILSGPDTTRIIKKHFPNIKVLILTEDNTDHDATLSLLSGADGCLSKKITSEGLFKAVRYAFWGDYMTTLDEVGQKAFESKKGKI